MITRTVSSTCLTALCVFALCGGALRLQPQTAPSPKDAGWRLVWSDEFNGPDGTGLDPAKWSVVTGGNGFGNEELESYTGRPENLRQQGGNLVVEARKEQYIGADRVARSYTSGRIETKAKFEQAYGRFEARMKLPLGKGLWPAFWLLGADTEAQGWPKCGEIDIMENIGEPQRVYGTLHGPGYSGAGGLSSHTDLPAGQAIQTDFHLYGVEWSPTEIRFSVDGNVYATRTPASLPAGARWVYDHPFFVLFDLAVGGKWPGDPDDRTRFPQQMLVDYVRVYQRGPTRP